MDDMKAHMDGLRAAFEQLKQVITGSHDANPGGNHSGVLSSQGTEFHLEPPEIVAYIHRCHVQVPHGAVKREYGENP
jgi:hypothetical protein